MYGEEALIRLDLVRSLRDAGVGIETIRKVLHHDLSLADALRLQLSAVEAHVASLQGVAAALRAALRGDPNESDVKRLCAVTKATNEERKAVIEQFHARIAEGVTVDDAWRKKMMAQIQDKNIDMDALRIATEEIAAAVARASGKAADEAFHRMFRERFAAREPRFPRYQELLAIMNGKPPPAGTSEDWRFIAEAINHHLHAASS